MGFLGQFVPTATAPPTATDYYGQVGLSGLLLQSKPTLLLDFKAKLLLVPSCLSHRSPQQHRLLLNSLDLAFLSACSPPHSKAHCSFEERKQAHGWLITALDSTGKALRPTGKFPK